MTWRFIVGSLLCLILSGGTIVLYESGRMEEELAIPFILLIAVMAIAVITCT